MINERNNVIFNEGDNFSQGQNFWTSLVGLPCTLYLVPCRICRICRGVRGECYCVSVCKIDFCTF
jgi:hypothetical protein